MRKIVSGFIPFLVLLLILAACSNDKGTKQEESQKAEETVLKVASLIPPMTDILEIAKPLLKEDGINLEIVILSDNVQPNNALANKEVDANFFQHVPYMEQYNESAGSSLTPVQPIYHAIYGAYSKKHKTLEELPDGAVISIANDASNVGRSLVLLEKAGLIKLKEGKGINATLNDITENKKNFDFKALDLLMLARSYDDVDLTVMTPAYASPLGLTPKKDALATETDDSAFAITLVSREDNKNDEAIKKLAERMTGPEVRKFLKDEYDEIAIPAF